MYYCINCNKQFNSREGVISHFLKCWVNTHPTHKSQPAHQSSEIIIEKNNEEILNFLKQVEIK